MRRMLMVLLTGVTLGFSTLALAADAPDCSEKQKAVDDAKAAGKGMAKRVQRWTEALGKTEMADRLACLHDGTIGDRRFAARTAVVRRSGARDPSAIGLGRGIPCPPWPAGVAGWRVRIWSGRQGPLELEQPAA